VQRTILFQFLDQIPQRTHDPSEAPSVQVCHATDANAQEEALGSFRNSWHGLSGSPSRAKSGASPAWAGLGSFRNFGTG